MKRLPAEWEPQDAVLLTWPHQDSDWAPLLSAAETTYFAIAEAILQFTNLLVVAPDAIASRLQARFADIPGSYQTIVIACPSDDTWARDHGPLCVEDGSQRLICDFTFNGWGNKFAAQRDNAITAALVDKQVLIGEHQQDDFVLEGGAIESDGNGTLLTTRACLLNPNRNPSCSQRDIEAKLQQRLGAEQVLWLSHGHLVGDDTDSHIDTLARLAPGNQIVYVRCDDDQDEHYDALQKMEAEIHDLRTREGLPFQLIPLPWPSAKYAQDGHRLPATYANFLITNKAVLVPTYQDENDEKALAQVGKAFPSHQIIGIDCSVLIEQHGSLHCITMQIPQGFLNHASFDQR